MNTVITLVGAPAVELARTLNGHMEVLASDAADVFVDAPLDDESRVRIANAPVDVFIQPAATRRKRVLLADMESTLIENEFLDDMADRLGLGEKVKEITQRGMEGGMDFAESLRQRAKLLQGAPASIIDDVLAGWRPSAGVREMIGMLQLADIPVWLVSSGFSCFTMPIGKALGCEVKVGNELLLNGDKLAGTVGDPIRDKHTKRAVLDDACTTLGIGLADTAAVGDGSNDLLMLQAAGAGFGHQAKPVVAAACKFNIRHSDLRAIAYAFGHK